jgi:hypothetical protein
MGLIGTIEIVSIQRRRRKRDRTAVALYLPLRARHHDHLPAGEPGRACPVSRCVCVLGWRMSVGTDAVDRFIQPRRQVSIRRDDNDFVVVFKPEDLIVFRNSSAGALRKACHFLRWEVVSEAVPEASVPAS